MRGTAGQAVTGILSFPLLQKENYYRQNKYAALGFRPVTAMGILGTLFHIRFTCSVFQGI